MEKARPENSTSLKIFPRSDDYRVFEKIWGLRQPVTTQTRNVGQDAVAGAITGAFVWCWWINF